VALKALALPSGLGGRQFLFSIEQIINDLSVHLIHCITCLVNVAEVERGLDLQWNTSKQADQVEMAQCTQKKSLTLIGVTLRAGKITNVGKTVQYIVGSVDTIISRSPYTVDDGILGRDLVIVDLAVIPGWSRSISGCPLRDLNDDQVASVTSGLLEGIVGTGNSAVDPRFYL